MTSVVNNRILAVNKWRNVTHPAHNTKWKWRCLHFGANPGRSAGLKCQQMTVMLLVLLYTESRVYFLYEQILDQSAVITKSGWKKKHD